MPSSAGAAEIREVEDLTRELFALGEDFDVILFQAEAIALLEAAVKALAVPGAPAATIMTSVYGDEMEAWFEAAGAPTTSLDLRGLDRAATPAEVERLLDAAPGIGVLAVVQGEALTGLVNPIDEIVAVAAARDVKLMIDSVSSVGAEPFTPELWGRAISGARAISVIGAQKGLGGPSGLSLAVIDRRLWDEIEANPAAPRRSFLSLLDIKRSWLDTGRASFFGMPSAEELIVLRTALRAAVARGIGAIEEEHRRAMLRARAVVREIPGLALTIADAEASAVATTFRLEDAALDPQALLARLAAAGSPAFLPAAGPRTLRWLHYDREAWPDRLESAAAALEAAVAREGSGRRAGAVSAER